MKKILLLICSLVTIVALQAQEKELLLYWTFDDSDAFDLSVNEFEGEVGEGITFSTETPAALGSGYSAYFIGDSTSYIINDTAEQKLNGLEAYTLSIWVKCDEDALNMDKIIFYANPANTADRAMALRYDQEGWKSKSQQCIKFGITVAGTGAAGQALEDTVEVNVETIDSVQTSSWQHLCVTWEAADTFPSIYIDGILTAANEGPSKVIAKADIVDAGLGYAYPSNPFLTGMSQVMLGQGSDWQSKNRNWKGYMDEVILYNFKVDADEVALLYAGTNLISSVDENELSAVSAYPNPFNNELNIELGLNHGFQTIELIDIAGKVIYTSTIEADIITVDESLLGNVAPGVFFVKLTGGEKVEIIKVVNQ